LRAGSYSSASSSFWRITCRQTSFRSSLNSAHQRVQNNHRVARRELPICSTVRIAFVLTKARRMFTEIAAEFQLS
jgi:hypothetical protein